MSRDEQNVACTFNVENVPGGKQTVQNVQQREEIKRVRMLK